MKERNSQHIHVKLLTGLYISAQQNIQKFEP